MGTDGYLVCVTERGMGGLVSFYIALSYSTVGDRDLDALLPKSLILMDS